jgi:hypothetical protein
MMLESGEFRLSSAELLMVCPHNGGFRRVDVSDRVIGQTATLLLTV